MVDERIHADSPEFKKELEKTKAYTDKACEIHNIKYGTDEVRTAIINGLTNKKILLGDYFCPCFVIKGDTLEERQANKDNRICPCVPALEKEIPQSGRCHCQLFYDKDQVVSEEDDLDDVNVLDILHIKQAQELLSQKEIFPNQLAQLLELRKSNLIDFTLIDVREYLEYREKRIIGVDLLVPTTSFYEDIKQVDDKKDETIILYCRSGNRSGQCQDIMQKDLGFKTVINVARGILGYNGDCESGD